MRKEPSPTGLVYWYTNVEGISSNHLKALYKGKMAHNCQLLREQ